MISYKLPEGLVEQRFPDGGLWYTYQGRYIRSVSKILNRIYPMPPGLDPFYLERGKAVHAATVLIDNGTLDMDALDHRLLAFCSAYQTFRRMAAPVIEASELVVIHPSYSYGARLDRVFRLPGQERLLVVDIKCGAGKEDRYWLQVAGCAVALDDSNVEKYDLALLNLNSKGKPSLTIAEDPGSWVNRWRQVLEEDVV
ncbi:MAG TPA: hypothetical protein VJ553_05280 [Candidatus Paceibacterota bacterium]|nr:hypothetical protein [Candidatus Paceibacterota bacterium]